MRAKTLLNLILGAALCLGTNSVHAQTSQSWLRLLEEFEIIHVMGKRSQSAARQCKNPALTGSPIGNIDGTLRGCGVKKPVRLTAVHGIPLNQPATVDCETANAFADWVDDGVIRQFDRAGRKVVSIDVLASYQCRTRNNRPGAKISEHGKGKAIDVGSFVLDNGARVSVFVDWRSRQWGQTMQAIHREACDHFGVVLGPNADVYHRDHFHMDTSLRRGAYCR